MAHLHMAYLDEQQNLHMNLGLGGQIRRFVLTPADTKNLREAIGTAPLTAAEDAQISDTLDTPAYGEKSAVGEVSDIPRWRCVECGHVVHRFPEAAAHSCAFCEGETVRL